MSSAVLSAHRPSVRAGVLAALLALLVPVLTATPASAGGLDPVCPLVGEGDTESPYLVATAEDLALVGFADLTLMPQPIDCGLDAEYRQTADITMPAPSGTPAVNHTPIGDDTNPFEGVYDGGGYEIRGLVVDGGTANDQGLFGMTTYATLTGIRLVDASVKGGMRVGSLVGSARATRIEDSSVSGSSRVEGSGARTGGLAGNVDGWFSDPAGDLTAVFSAADVIGSVEAGGLVGYAQSGSGASLSISEAYATGTVTGSRRLGGLVGYMGSGSIERSFATGAVTANLNNDGEAYDVGGLVGVTSGSATILDSYATGVVETKGTAPANAARTGGLVGEVDSPNVVIERSYAIGQVIAPQGSDALGGLVGGDRYNDIVTASFWGADTTSQPASSGGPGAVGRTTAQMKSIGTFSDAGWAIVPRGVGGASDVWGICTRVNDGYPFLLWQVAGASSDPCGGAAPEVGPSFVAPGGVLPLQSPGLGEWVQSDGSSVPLAVSSPGPNQVRYSAEGVQVTFTGGAGSNVSNGLVANPNGEIVCEVCVALAAGQVIEVWMFSTPRLVAAHLTEDLPCQRFTVPVVAPLDGGGPVSAGAHTLQLALPTAQGMQAVNVGVTVGGPVPGSVPAGEGPAVPAGLLLLGLLAAAGGLLAARRSVVTG